jgi:hypothetical protein
MSLYAAAVCGKYMPQRCRENVNLYLTFTFFFVFFTDQVFAFSRFLTGIMTSLY